MKKGSAFILMGLAIGIFTSCSDTNNNTNNNTNSNTFDGGMLAEENGSAAAPSSDAASASATEPSDKPKSDEELVLEATEAILDGVSDIAETVRIKDSIRQVNKDKMYAFQIGIKMKEDDAYAMYQKLIDMDIPSVYVFKGGRKEYYIVQFEAKGEEELSLQKGEFKTKLGELGSEGLKVVNLNDFCKKKQSVSRETKNREGDEVKCLYCD